MGKDVGKEKITTQKTHLLFLLLVKRRRRMRDTPLPAPLLIEFGVRGERLRHEGLPIHARQKRKELDVSRGGVMRRPKLLKSLALLLDILGRRIAARLHADVDREPLENSRRKHVRVRLLLGGLPLVPSSRAPKHDIALFRVHGNNLAFFLDEEKIELLLVFDEVESDILPGRKPLAKLLAKLVRAQNHLLPPNSVSLDRVLYYIRCFVKIRHWRLKLKPKF